MVANKRLTLNGTAFAPGDDIPPTAWASLRERTRQTLVGGRFVLTPEDAVARKARAAVAVAPPPAAPKRRGRPPKVKEVPHGL